MAKLKIMTWNVLYKERAENILSLVKRINPDIILCQELTTDSYFNPARNIPEIIASELNAEYEYQEAFEALDEETGAHFAMGNGIFSKLPIANRRHVYVQKSEDSSASYSEQTRVYVEIDVEIDGKPLKIGTTHLTFTPFFKITPRREAEFGKLLDAIKENKSGFIIGGDFNAAHDSKLIRTMEASFKNVGPDGSEKTFTTKPFSYQDFTVNGLEWRLDYIFATPDIKVLSSKIIKTDFSDHLPILVEVEA